MDKLKRFIPSRRKLIQLYAALLTNAHAKGFIEGEIYTGPIKNVCVPGLNCYSCPGAIGACPLGALQNALASSGHRAPYYVLGILMVLGLTLGRIICGWLCPMGLIQELAYKLPTPKIKKSPVTRVLSWLKYVVLVVFVLIIPLSYSLQQYPVPAFCKYICPAGTLEGAMGLLANPVNSEKFSMLGILFTRKFVILILILTACVFLYRAFCRFLCPLGAIYGLFNRVALFGVKVKPDMCTHCGKCVAHCKMDIRHVGDHECIQCGSCAAVCHAKAIIWKGKRRSEDEAPKAPARTGVKAWISYALALCVLAGVMWYVNRPSEAPAQAAANQTEIAEQLAAEDDDTPVGKEVGMRAPDFSAPIYGGGTFSLSGMKGKVVVLNFWATWCTPCVGELPYFQKVNDTWAEDVAVIALHSNMVTDDVQAFLDRESYTMPFGLDEDGSIIASFGGSTMLPMTVVIDRTGKIVYNRIDSVTYEELESLVKPLLEGK